MKSNVEGMLGGVVYFIYLLHTVHADVAELISPYPP